MSEKDRVFDKSPPGDRDVADKEALVDEKPPGYRPVLGPQASKPAKEEA